MTVQGNTVTNPSPTHTVTSSNPVHVEQLVLPNVIEAEQGSLGDDFVIVSIDVETSATKLLQGDLLSIGACTYWENDEKRMETFYINLMPVYGRNDADTMQNFWAKFPERYRETQVNQVNAMDAMKQFADWVNGLGAEPVFMAWPAHFDFMWIDLWFMHAGIENPFSYKPLDQVSYAAGLTKDWKQVKGSRSKGTLTLPKEWEGENLTPHNALADAIAQRNGFIKMVNDTRSTRSTKSTS